MKTKYERIIEKAVELCLMSDVDEMIYGDSYVEIGERFIKVLDPNKESIILSRKN